MGKALGVLFAYLIIGIWEIVPIARRRENGEIVTYVLLWAAALAFSLLLVGGVKFPSLEIWMIRVYKTITGGGG